MPVSRQKSACGEIINCPLINRPVRVGARCGHTSGALSQPSSRSVITLLCNLPNDIFLISSDGANTSAIPGLSVECPIVVFRSYISNPYQLVGYLWMQDVTKI